MHSAARPEAPSIRSAVWSIDNNVPITDLQPMTQVVAQSIAQPRSTMLMLTLFAGIGLVLGIIGIYGVISYSVAQRTHEIGVRMALGARPADVLKLIIKQGMILGGGGVVIGLIVSFAMSRVLASQLYGITSTDPLTFAAISLLLILVAVIACYIPARRATKVDPMVAVRYE